MTDNEQEENRDLLINPYGQRMQDKAEERGYTCSICESSLIDIIVFETGWADASFFCSPKCVIRAYAKRLDNYG